MSTQGESLPKFGAELKDAFKPVNAWVLNGISWLDEVQSFYRERSAIEKEYASRLSSLAKRYHEKKAKKASVLSVGETPAITPGSLESASMATWTTQLNTIEQRAQQHDDLGNLLLKNLADPLKYLSTKYEELRKAHVEYNTRLEKERDASYADLKKMKSKYDTVCQEVENKRKRSDAGKGQSAFLQQQSEMHNVKNTYIISINVTNKQKDMYYNHYVPDLLDSLQDLNETKVDRLNAYWLLASRLEKEALTNSVGLMDHLAAEIPRNVPHLDSLMFARHNAGSTSIPADMMFEPSPVWHDEATLAVDEAAKNFLRNVLLKSKSQLVELKRDVDGKRREVEAQKKVRKAVRDGKDTRDEVEVVKAAFQLQELLHESERQKITAEVEISTITSTVGDVSVGARNHNFKSETFTIPTHCDFCGDRIWGLSARGFSCRDCGFTCHSKCEMKVPAECPGELSKEEKKKVKVQRQQAAQLAITSQNGSMTDVSGDVSSLHRSDTMNTLSSGFSAVPNRSVSVGTMPQSDDDSPKAVPSTGPRRHILKAPPPASFASDPPPVSSERRGRMLYSYDKTNPGDVSASEGQDVVIVEPDDGSGWVTVRIGSDQGLVPASYLDILPPAASHATLAAPAPARPESAYSNHSSAASLSNSMHTAGSSITASNTAYSNGAASSSTTPVLGTGSSTSGTSNSRKKGPAVAPKRGAKKLKYVEALYDYVARTELEHSMREGERLLLVAADTGDGWAEVEKGGVRRSVPANYVQEV